MKQGGFWGLATLVVVGAIVADVLTHPKGTAVVSNGLVKLVRSSLNAASGRPI
jgi:hypothetical protein